MVCESKEMRAIAAGVSDPRNQHDLLVVSEDDLFPVWLELMVASGKVSDADAQALKFSQDPGYAICRAQAEAKSRINGWVNDAVDGVVGGVKRAAASKVKELIGPTFYRGWNHSPRL